MSKYYLSIDPGKTTGYALFTEDGSLEFMGKIQGVDKFLDYLEDLIKDKEFIVFIIERYRNRPGMKHNIWSEGPTQQHIGAITRIARKNHIKVEFQDPNPGLVIGLKFLGLSTAYKDKHVPDDVSALAHGTYFLRKAGVTSG